MGDKKESWSAVLSQRILYVTYMLCIEVVKSRRAGGEKGREKKTGGTTAGANCFLFDRSQPKINSVTPSITFSFTDCFLCQPYSVCFIISKHGLNLTLPIIGGNMPRC